MLDVLWWIQIWEELVGVMVDDYDQNTFYDIFKELIK